MRYLLILDFFDTVWSNFYNKYVRDVSDFNKSLILLGLLLASCMSMVFAIRTKNKEEVMNSWTMFWLSIVFFVLAVLYSSL